jgi:hypothetical protein
MSDTGKEPVSFICLRNATHNYMVASLHIKKIMEVQSSLGLIPSPLKPENQQTDIQKSTFLPHRKHTADMLKR